VCEREGTYVLEKLEQTITIRTYIREVPGSNLDREVDYHDWGFPGFSLGHSSPSSAEVKNGGAIPPLLHKSSWRGAQQKI
jgi:hypothetical protein